MVTVGCAVTQEDQDNADEEKKRESMQTLIQTWLDSLQLISVIVSKIPNALLTAPNHTNSCRTICILQTTFFVATEASWLLITIPSPTDRDLSTMGQLANIGILSALVVHGHAGRLLCFCIYIPSDDV